MQSPAPKEFGVPLKAYNKSTKEYSYPRLWRAPYNIEYLMTHNFWRHTDTQQIFRSTINYESIPGIFMRGNDKERGDEYLKKSYEYQKKLMHYEKPFKEQYRKVAQNTKQHTKDFRLPGVPMV
jgi:hypothetical protein